MNRYIALTTAIAGGGLLTAAFLQVAVAAAETGTAADISDYAFTIDGTTFDPGSDGYNTFGPLAGLAPLLEIGAGSTGIALAPNATQPLEVYGSGSDVGTVHTSTTASDILGIDTAQFTVKSITPPVDEVQAALTNSDLDFSAAGVSVSNLANALTEASGYSAIPFGTGDITGGEVSYALFVSGISLPPSITGADIAGVLNGLDTSDLPDVGTVYSFTDLGSGWANVYVAVPNDDGTAAATITDTLVTPFGNIDIPTGYDAVAQLDPGAAFDGFGATSDSSDISDNAFTLGGLTFDPGSDGFASLFPLFSVAPLLELGGGQLAVEGATPSPFAIEPLEVYNSSGSDLGTVVTAENVQNLLGFVDATQLTVYGYYLPETDLVSALTNSDIDFSSLDTTAADVADALGTIDTYSGPVTASHVFSDLYSSGISISFPEATEVADVINSAVDAYTPSADLPAEGTVYSVTDLGGGFANVYIATPNADGTAAASITDTLVTPWGNLDIPTSYDAIAPMDPGEPFAGLGVTSDNGTLSDNAFTIAGTTFDPGSDGFTPVAPLSGNAPLLEIGGGFPVGAGNPAVTEDLDVFGSSGDELGSIDTGVTTANLFGLIDVTQLGVHGYNVPTSDLVSALASSDVDFTNADFTADDLVTALENVKLAAFNLGGGDLTGQDIRSALVGSDISIFGSGVDPDNVADVINGATDAYAADTDLPELGTVYSVIDFGGGWENVYMAIPNADGTEASSITDYLVTPFGNIDLSTMFDAIAPLDPGDAAAGVSTAVGGAFDLFDPSSWF